MIAMIMAASTTGNPIKDQLQIQMLRVQYLERRAIELVLLEEAAKRKVSAPERQIDQAVSAFTDQMGWTAGNLAENLGRMGVENEAEFREIFREKLQIDTVTSQLRQELAAEPGTRLNQLIDRYRDKSGVQTFPGRL